MCVSGYISKQIRVVTKVAFNFFSKILFIIFPDFNKKHNRCIVFPKYIMKRGVFGPVTYVLTKNMNANVAAP